MLFFERMPESNVEEIVGKSDGDFVQCDVWMLEWMQNRLSNPACVRKFKEEKLHVVHSDIVGPAESFSFGKARYILTVIVERSRFAKVYVIQKLSQVVQRFQESRACLKGVMEDSAKRLHSDQVLEYMSIREIIRREGIENTSSTGYRSSQMD